MRTRWQPKSVISFDEIRAIATIAGLVALCVFVLAIAALDADWQDEIRAAFILSALAFIVVLGLAYYAERLWLPAVEEISGRDLDGDGVVGRPSDPPVHTTSTILVNRGEPVRLYRIPGSSVSVVESKLVRFLEGVEDSDGLTFAAAQQAGLTRKEWNEVISAGVKLALWSPKSQGQDAELQAGGAEVMDAFFPN